VNNLVITTYYSGEQNVKNKKLDHRVINDLIAYKKERYPDDKRIVVVCGINPKKNIHVEWHYPAASDVNA
jgi:hypothetical protein